MVLYVCFVQKSAEQWNEKFRWNYWNQWIVTFYCDFYNKTFVNVKFHKLCNLNLFEYNNREFIRWELTWSLFGNYKSIYQCNVSLRKLLMLLCFILAFSIVRVIAWLMVEFMWSKLNVNIKCKLHELWGKSFSVNKCIAL